MQQHDLKPCLLWWENFLVLANAKYFYRPVYYIWVISRAILIYIKCCFNVKKKINLSIFMASTETAKGKRIIIERYGIHTLLTEGSIMYLRIRCIIRKIKRTYRNVFKLFPNVRNHLRTSKVFFTLSSYSSNSYPV